MVSSASDRLQARKSVCAIARETGERRCCGIRHHAGISSATPEAPKRREALIRTFTDIIGPVFWSEDPNGSTVSQHHTGEAPSMLARRSFATNMASRPQKM